MSHFMVRWQFTALRPRRWLRSRMIALAQQEHS